MALDAFKQSIAAYRAVTKMSADEHFYLGNACLQTNQSEQAIAAFRQAIKLRQNFAQPYLSLGVAYSTAGNQRAALEVYESLKQIDPERAGKLYKVITRK